MSRGTIAVFGAAASLVAAALVLPAWEAQSRQDDASFVPPPAPSVAPLPVCTAGQSGAPSSASAAGSFGYLRSSTSRALLQAESEDEFFVRFDLSSIGGGARLPLSLALVIDRSGSMAGDKVSQARTAAMAILDRLGPDDRVALIQYDSTAEILVPLTPADALGKLRLRGAIAGLYPGSQTNLGAGLSEGQEALQQTLEGGHLQRMLLLSDGLANRGVSDVQGLARLAEEAAQAGISVTTIGVGLDYDEDALEAIAEAGRGRYYYVKDAAGLRGVLEGELEQSLTTVARALSLRLEPACAGFSVAEVYDYTTRQEPGGAWEIPLADLSASEDRKLVVRMRASQLPPGQHQALRAVLRYQDPRSGKEEALYLTLGGEAIHDAAAVEAASNPDVMGSVLEARGSQLLRQAAFENQSGNARAANRLLLDGNRELAEQARYYNIPEATAAPVLEVINSSAADLLAEPKTESAKAAVKGYKAKARELAR